MRRRSWLGLMVVLLTVGLSANAFARMEGRADLLERELLYSHYAGDDFTALGRYRAALDDGELQAGESRWAALAARLYASWGLFEEAEELYLSPILGATPEQRSRNRLELGRAYYRRQYHDEAVETLQKVGIRQLPKELEYERLLMMGVSLYQLDNLAGSSSALWSIHPTSPLYPYARLDIGMGSIRIGSWPGGISGLNSLKKRLDIDVEATPQFIDRLNTVFGYILLYEEYSGSRTAYGKVSMHGFTTPAKKGYRDSLEMLRAVSEDGLYANKALLGRAWIAIDTNELERARELLTRLDERDPRHLVVQEAKLALPYVLEREGKVREAIGRYRTTVRFFEQERDRLDTLLQRLGRGELDTAFLTMRSRRRLNRMSGSEPLEVMREIERQQTALDDVYLRAVQQLRAKAEEQLTERRRRINHYLAQARYGLAELYGRLEQGGVDAKEALAAYHAYLEEAPEVSDEVRKHIIGRIADLELELGDEAREAVPAAPLSGVAAYLAELEKNPQEASNEDVLYKLARAYEQQGETGKALETLQRLIRRFPDSGYVAEARFRVAEGLFMEQDYQRAAATYSEILTSKKDNPYYYHALYKRGWSLYRLGRYQQALEGEQGRANQELYADARRAINLCFVNMNGPASVADFFAGNRHHRYIEAVYQSLADYYLDQERINDAVQTWSTYIRSYPNSQDAPRYLLKIVATWKEQGFEKNLVAARERLIREYGLHSPFWNSHDPTQFRDVRLALKESTRLLAEHYHIAARESGKRQDYLQAAEWYRRYLQNYPDDQDAAELNYLYAEILEEAGRYQDAVTEYLKVVERYPRFAKRADAGYAAVLLAFQQAESGPKEEREQWRRRSYDIALDFANRFPGDGRASDVLLRLAEESYRRREYPRAITLAQRVAAQGDTQQRQKALLIVGHSQFETGKYLAAEQSYHALLQSGRVSKDRRREITRRMALAIYRQGEAAREAGNVTAAVEHFLRVRKEVPSSPIVPTAEYDAAAALISLSRCGGGVRTARGAGVQCGEEGGGAVEGGRALCGKRSPAAGHRARQKLVALYESVGDEKQRDYWRKQIIDADRKAPVSNERSRYLAMTAALEIADAKYREYQAVRLTVPLKKSLRRKKKLLKQAIDAYALVAGYGDASTITRAGYQIGEIYYQFARALMDSERPRGLNEEELEQYDLLLEEQAFPFEEKALEFYRSNRVRILDGLYDQWIQKSLDRLAEIFPARYSRPEKQDAYVEALQ